MLQRGLVGRLVGVCIVSVTKADHTNKLTPIETDFMLYARVSVHECGCVSVFVGTGSKVNVLPVKHLRMLLMSRVHAIERTTIVYKD